MAAPFSQHIDEFFGLLCLLLVAGLWLWFGVSQWKAALAERKQPPLVLDAVHLADQKRATR